MLAMKRVSTIFFCLILVISSVFAISLEDAKSLDRPTVAVVLSGGEERGLGHIVLLSTLEKLGIPIDAVYGSSSGAIIGGLYCAGYSPKEIVDIFTETPLLAAAADFNSTVYKAPKYPNQTEIDNLLTIDNSKNGILSISGLLKNEKIVNCLNRYLSGLPYEVNFDDLPVKFRCTVTESLNGNLVIPESGNLIQTITTACAMPLAFTPVYKDGVLYSDGGLTNNLPADIARKEGYDIVITENMNAYAAESDNNDFMSLSTMIFSLLRTIVDRETADMHTYSDLYITPDFSSTKHLVDTNEAIMGVVEKAIEDNMDELLEIASLFEDGKYVKDPARVGEYNKLFAKDNGKYPFTLQPWIEKLPTYSIISLAINGFDSFSESSIRRMPLVSLRYYDTNLGNSNFGLDARLSWEKEAFKFKAKVPYSLTSSLFASIDLGLSFTGYEYGLSLQKTDREKYFVDFGILRFSNEKTYLKFSGIFSDSISSKKLKSDKYNVEFTSFYDIENKGYDFSLEGDYSLYSNDDLLIWSDIAVRKTDSLNLSDTLCGGKYMKQFDILSCTNYASFGLSFRYTFLKSIVDFYSQIQLRAVLADFNTSLYNISIAVGSDTPIGDVSLGFALNGEKQVSVFFDFR